MGATGRRLLESTTRREAASGKTVVSDQIDAPMTTGAALAIDRVMIASSIAPAKNFTARGSLGYGSPQQGEGSPTGGGDEG